MANLTLAEKILSLVTYLNESQSKIINTSKLKEILGDPPKATYYRVLNILISGGQTYRPLLLQIDQKNRREKERYYQYYFYKNKQK